MTLEEIKKQAITTALVEAIYKAQNDQVAIVKRLHSPSLQQAFTNTNYVAIKEFRVLQQRIDEAFSELFDPKPTCQ